MTLRSADGGRLDGKLASALGPVLPFLEEPKVTDVNMNGDGSVYVERIDAPSEPVGLRLSEAQRATLIKTLATLVGRVVNEAHPELEAELPGSGCRVHALLPPVVRGSTVSIRKPPSVIYTLDDYVEAGRMTLEQREVLVASVRGRSNILVVGATGSGKTTLANALLHEVAQSSPAQRVVLIEDTRELQCSVSNMVSLKAVPGVMTMGDLLRSSLRLRPDRIVVGEVRGAEALTLIKAWNTGHPGGICTVHANDALSGLMRIEQAAAEGTLGWVPRAQIAEAIQVVVFIGRGPEGRRVEQILRVRDQLTRAGEYDVVEVGSWRKAA